MYTKRSLKIVKLKLTALWLVVFIILGVVNAYVSHEIFLLYSNHNPKTNPNFLIALETNKLIYFFVNMLLIFQVLKIWVFNKFTIRLINKTN